jgi:hypothetical protein
LYKPDARNLYHQKFCAKADCRKASKRASQRRWRASSKGRDYFKGEANVLRVQAWRKAHPGYWKKPRKKAVALQDHSLPQLIVPAADRSRLNAHALQDFMRLQGLALTGLFAHLSGSPLQDNIVSFTRRVILLGRQVQGLPAGGGTSDGRQTGAVPGTVAAGAATVQLGGPSAGTG